MKMRPKTVYWGFGLPCPHFAPKITGWTISGRLGILYEYGKIRR
jgi:hypothetical protein